MEENISPHAHAEAKNIKRAEGCVRKQKKIFLKRTEIQKKNKAKTLFSKRTEIRGRQQVCLGRVFGFLFFVLQLA